MCSSERTALGVLFTVAYSGSPSRPSRTCISPSPLIKHWKREGVEEEQVEDEEVAEEGQVTEGVGSGGGSSFSCFKH